MSYGPLKLVTFDSEVVSTKDYDLSKEFNLKKDKTNNNQTL